MMKIKRKINFVLAIAIMLTVFRTSVNAATFDELNQSGMFLKQNTSYTCTLSSAAMMVRRAALASGNNNWASITESSMRSTAWLEGTGLYFNFTYAGISVSHNWLVGGSGNANQVISLLNEHPEGIVIYDQNKPHAILVTDYSNGVFYCADPANNTPVGRIPISSASISMSNADAYWYVSSPQISIDYIEQKPITAWDYVSGTADSIIVRGWAYDPNTLNQSVTLHVYIDDMHVSTITANKERTDVNNAYGCGNYHGFEAIIPYKVTSTSEHKVSIYALNTTSGAEATYMGTQTVTINPRPNVTNVTVSNVSETGYTITCNVEAESGINRVQFPTWTNYNGQDDLSNSWNTSAQYSGSISGNTVSYRVNASEHNGEIGLYYTHIYAYANDGTHTCVPVTANLGPNTLTPVKTTEYNGSRYEVYIVDDAISERTVWTYAKTFAESVGGHLATITSQAEQDVINTMITTQVEGYWIGGTDEVSEGSWRWVTGEPFTYENWASNQPDNGFGMQNYLALWPSVGKWDDGLNDAETVDYGFIVEYNLHVHNHKQTGYKAATCTQNGVITYACVCGDTYTSDIVAPGHKEMKDKAVAATCTTAGKTEGKHCSVCNKVLVAQEQIKALGHIWKAENTANGIITSVCTTCGEKKEENDPNVQKPQFEDVRADAYYADAVQWAVENGITNGYGSESTFCPDIECTRGQVVTFLWRAAGSPEPVSLNNPFMDVANNTYYYKAVLWAVENGITAGYGSDTLFNPDGVCNRAQVATFMWRAAGKPSISGLNNRFTDISCDTYYYDAVLWAVENGITNGYGSDTIFNPDGNCTRGQIVTFLYRGMN